MGKYFGTDGIRGIPWKFPFTPHFLRKLGYCISYFLKKKRKFPVYIGMDSRSSGEKIKQFISQGIVSNGFKIIDVGIVTTPCLSYLSNKNKASFGIMISASHNPPKFNGVKFFSSDGKKIDDALELQIEDMLDSEISFPISEINEKNFLKKDLSEEYIRFILSTFPKNFNLKGYKICLDCANGGGYLIAPEIFKRLGAEIVLIGNKPDGKNINKNLGALYPDKMRRKTLESKAFCGISLDGDGDRCILSDEKGRVFDGDDIIAVLSLFFKNTGALKKNGVVLTVMSNYGLVKYLNKLGIKVVQVNVGDKNVTEALDKSGFILGGENSGHIIIRKFSPTGDGILSSLWTLYAAKYFNKTLSELKDLWYRYPQELSSLKVEKKIPLNELENFSDYLKELEKKINGRVLVRYSGTEPVLRIMVEAEDELVVKNSVKEIEKLYLTSIKNFSEKT